MLMVVVILGSLVFWGFGFVILGVPGFAGF